MGIFNRKKNNQTTNQPVNGNETEFDRDIKTLLARDDIQSRSEICQAEYNKALGLLKNPTQETIHRAYDLMGNLAAQFEYVPAIMWMGDFTENYMHNNMQAASWYKKAADKGDGNGSRCYADMLMTGNGVSRDTQLAMRYYADAAEKGIPEAAFVLGEYLRNTGDIANALKAYNQAYAGGYAPAKTRIDQMQKSSVKTDNVPWRINGKIACRDSTTTRCSQKECIVPHEECPIMLHTEAELRVIKQPAEAAKLYEKAIHIAPDYAMAWDGLASAYWFMNDKDRAVETQKKACELKPDCLSYGCLVSYLRQLKRFDEARTYLQELKKYSTETYEVEKKYLEEDEAAAGIRNG